jgi:DnaJ-class molecular chaperone
MPTEPEGATPANIVNHPFVPEGEWWSQCKTCGLSEAAHFTTTLCPSCGGAGVMAGRDEHGNYERCDPCEGTGVTAETDVRDVSRPELEGQG